MYNMQRVIKVYGEWVWLFNEVLENVHDDEQKDTSIFGKW